MPKLGKLFGLCAVAISRAIVFIKQKIEFIGSKIKCRFHRLCDGISNFLLEDPRIIAADMTRRERTEFFLQDGANHPLATNWACVNLSVPQSWLRNGFQSFRLETRRNIISENMHFQFNRVLMICCWDHTLRPDILATITGKHDKNVSVRVKWISVKDKNMMMRLTIAIFSDEWKAEKARIDLNSISRSIVIIRFQTFVNTLHEAESVHPEAGRYPTKIFIFSKRCLSEKNCPGFEKELHAFGNVEYSNFLRRRNHLRGVAYYSFSTQAIVAKLLLDRMIWRFSGLISIGIKIGKKEKDILSYAADKLSALYAASLKY